jgi:NAD(P)-dependent dehydrogenase (short-subunit alcohol dehydrogenase family)
VAGPLRRTLAAMSETETVLITGAGGALAESVIPRFAALGWRTALFDRDDGARARERYPDAWVCGVDLADEAATRAAVERTEAEAGPLAAVVHLAGGFAITPAAELSSASLLAQLSMNLVSAVHVTTAALPRMLQRGRGTIVGIAAGQAVAGGARVPAYAASKAALVAYLRSVDLEVGSEGVRTVAIYPMGTLDTAANRSAMPFVDPSGWISADALADAIALAVTVGPQARFEELRVHPDATRRAG